MKLQSSRGYLAFETALFFLLNFFAAKLAGMAARALGVTLPDMPLLVLYGEHVATAGNVWAGAWVAPPENFVTSATAVPYTPEP